MSKHRASSLGISILCIAASCLSVADQQTMSTPERIYIAANIVDYSANSLSPDKRKLLIREWDSDSKTNVLSQRIKIVDLANGNVLSQLSFSSNDKKSGLFELGTVSWDSQSLTVFFTVTGNDGIVEKWDIKSGKHEKSINTLAQIARMAVSPEGKRFAYIEYDSDSSGRLKVYALDTGKITELDSDVNYVPPIWKDESSILFVKKNSIHEYRLKNSKSDKLVEFTDGKVRNAEIQHKDELWVTLWRGLDVKKSKEETTFTSLTEVWRYHFLTKHGEKIVSFRSGSAGIASAKHTVVFPLSLDYENSQLVSYDESRKVFQQITKRHKKNDLPLFLADGKTVLYRGDNREILLLRY